MKAGWPLCVAAAIFLRSPRAQAHKSLATLRRLWPSPRLPISPKAKFSTKHSPSWVGTLATAGGVVFSGSDDRNFFALDAETGKARWEIYLGASLRSNPVMYSVEGKQYLFVTAGTTYFAFTLP